MRIGIVSDHRGVKLKEQIKNKLIKNNYLVEDYGTNNYESVDFPKYAFILGEKLKNKEIDFGIAICGTGIGMSIALNKVKGVMCAKIDNKLDAKYAKEHNDVNAIAISANNSLLKTLKLLTIFLKSEKNKNNKYQKRIDMIKEYENR